MARSAPLTNAVVEDDFTWVLVAPEGAYREVDVSVSEDQYRQMWNGYMCAYCYEPWSSPWPEKCTVPGCWSGEVSEQKQRAYLDERYGGEKWLGPSKATVASWETAAVRNADKRNR